MKVLITTDLYTTNTNGVVTSIDNLCEALIALGHDVRILTLADGMHSYRIGSVFYIRSVPIGAIYPDVRMATAYRHRLIEQLIEWHPDVIHSQCEFFSFQFAHHIAKETGAPIVHTYHTLYEQYVTYVVPIKGVGEKAVGTLSRLRLKEVKCIIAPTKKVEDTLRSYGITAPIAVVPSGINLDRFRNAMNAEERSQRRKALGIEDTDRVLLNLGRLGNEKNLDELIGYFASVRSEYPNLKFLIVGDGPAREQLEKQVAELEIQDRVIFTGMVPPTQVREYYQLGDIFVSASTSETQGLTYIEAAANGLPLLCRKDPCLQDVMVCGENGYEYTDAEQFRQGLAAILSDEQWRFDASVCSREIADSFGKEAFGAAVEKVYRSLLSAETEGGCV